MEILMVLGLWVIAIFLGLIFFKGASVEEDEKKVLKPLDMEKSKLSINLFDEMRKCNEEDDEFLSGVMKCDIDNIIEEFWDSVQTKLNVMSMLGIPTEMIYRGLNKHIKKIKERGYKFKD